LLKLEYFLKLLICVRVFLKFRVGQGSVDELFKLLFTGVKDLKGLDIIAIGRNVLKVIVMRMRNY